MSKTNKYLLMLKLTATDEQHLMFNEVGAEKTERDRQKEVD